MGELLGEKKVAWQKAMMSAGVADGVVTKLACSGGGVGSKCQRLVVSMDRVAVKIILLLRVMVQLWERKVASQPASQSLPMDTREVLPKLGKRCASVA